MGGLLVGSIMPCKETTRKVSMTGSAGKECPASLDEGGRVASMGKEDLTEFRGQVPSSLYSRIP